MNTRGAVNSALQLLVVGSILAGVAGCSGGSRPSNEVEPSPPIHVDPPTPALPSRRGEPEKIEILTPRQDETVEHRDLVISDMELDVKVAATDRARARGWMFRKSIGEREALLFVFPRPEVHAFWMKDHAVSIDIAYVDEAFRIVDAYTMLPEPETSQLADFKRYRSSRPTPYALQMRGGWLKEHGVKVGDRIDLSSALSGIVPE